MNAQQKPGTFVNDHMITLIGYFAEAADNEANLDQNTQIEMVFKRLSKDFASFQAVYNLGNKNLALTQLMKELQSYELILNGSQLIQKA
ncbi:Retrovirus-related Pol polyprotein from transposon TNT 1-94 [Gossypium australe]|uniref:Retrovirus-related Pol polyprotein from transposon TNT 1-94 n=1 Tax=Gossypium australe TaxID=47621 RepID=A0A5B6UZX4_9ROSI|nr:Retrovirus-related Pol polyprotein from transposon TNT 1-94 [Gossypium australe]